MLHAQVDRYPLSSRPKRCDTNAKSDKKRTVNLPLAWEVNEVQLASSSRLHNQQQVIAGCLFKFIECHGDALMTPSEKKKREM